MSAVTNKGTISMYQFKRMAVPAKPQSKEGVPLTSAGVSVGLQPAGPPSQQQQQQTALFPEPRKAITAHKRYALKCAFSPDSTMVATTSADQTTRLWRTSDLGLITVSPTYFRRISNSISGKFCKPAKKANRVFPNSI